MVFVRFRFYSFSQSINKIAERRMKTELHISFEKKEPPFFHGGHPQSIQKLSHCSISAENLFTTFTHQRFYLSFCNQFGSLFLVVFLWQVFFFFVQRVIFGNEKESHKYKIFTQPRLGEVNLFFFFIILSRKNNVDDILTVIQFFFLYFDNAR